MCVCVCVRGEVVLLCVVSVLVGCCGTHQTTDAFFREPVGGSMVHI